MPIIAGTYCPCCGLSKPAYDFPAGKRICSLCCMLDQDTVSFLTRDTIRRETGVKAYTAQGRKIARITARMELYAREGKRCSACHFRKPASEFNKCAPQSDGLQVNCMSCNKIWLESRKAGGPTLWHTVRDAMRKASPEGK